MKSKLSGQYTKDLAFSAKNNNSDLGENDKKRMIRMFQGFCDTKYAGTRRD